MPVSNKYTFIGVWLVLFICAGIQAQVKILPLGNSITYDQIKDDTRSASDKIAYRFKLYQLLTGAGYSFDYVGSEKAGGNYLPEGFDDNGGFPGLTNSQLLAKLKSGYLNQYNPDIILLEIGTNGLRTNTDAEIFINQLDSILEEIDVYEKAANKVVPLFLAQIINRAGTNPNGNHLPTSYYNTLMADLKNKRIQDNITLVNMETGAGIDYRYYQDGGDMNDLLHPVQGGYVKMAEEWFTVLDPYFASLVNDIPMLGSLETTDLAYNEGAGQHAISSAITVSDSDNADLQKAVMTFTAGYKATEDILSFTATNGITSVWDTATRTLTLAGTSSQANYQAALRSVLYENSNVVNPSTTARTISFMVNDGTDNSNIVTRNISVIHINKAPVIGDIETSDLKFNIRSEPKAITSTLSITDLDDTILSSASVQINSGYVLSEDVLSFEKTDSISSVWNMETGILNLAGTATVTEYQTALRNIKYNNSNENSQNMAPRVITFTVNDGKINSNSLQRSIALNADSSLSNELDLELKGIIIEPNPASDFVKIIFPNSLSTDVKIEIINVQGSIIMTDQILKDKSFYQFNVSDFAIGLYMIRLTGKKRNNHSHKISVFR